MAKPDAAAETAATDMSESHGGGVLRACAMTLISLRRRRRGFAWRSSEILAGLMKEHPSRAVVVRLKEGEDFLECPRIRAVLDAVRPPPADLLRAGGNHLRHGPSGGCRCRSWRRSPCRTCRASSSAVRPHRARRSAAQNSSRSATRSSSIRPGPALLGSANWAGCWMPARSQATSPGRASRKSARCWPSCSDNRGSEQIVIEYAGREAGAEARYLRGVARILSAHYDTWA